MDDRMFDLFNRIAVEYGCSAQDAAAMLGWLINGLWDHNGTWYPNDANMATFRYTLFDQMFPHGTKPAAGSIAAEVAVRVVDAVGFGVSVFHDQLVVGDSTSCSIVITTGQSRPSA